MKTYNTILFRADANPSIGFGHIMRCLSIADAAASVYQKVLFIMADGIAGKYVAGRGYQPVILDTEYADLEGELEKVGSVLAENKPGTLVVDSYFATERYLDVLWSMCRNINCRLVYIDDVLAFPYPCDVLINYGIYGSREGYQNLYKGKNLPVLLLGTSFVPLRREFKNLAPRTVQSQARDILCSTGGSDSSHMALELVKAINKPELNGWIFHIIVGAMNEDRKSIYDIVRDSSNIILHEDVQNMGVLMMSCDAAISAAGTTLYELCATQTPTVTYILSDNQIPNAERFEHLGISKCAGDVRTMGAAGLAEGLLELAVELCGDWGERLRIAKRMSRIVDGHGAERIVKNIV